MPAYAIGAFFGVPFCVVAIASLAVLFHFKTAPPKIGVESASSSRSTKPKPSTKGQVEHGL
jgi:hypothetical protein